MNMKVLALNCGSSSIKYQLYDMPDRTVLARGLLERIGEENARLVHRHDDSKMEKEQPVADHQQGLELILAALQDAEHGVLENVSEIGAVGHRVVHGGEKYSGSVVIDDNVVAAIEGCADLAPLHNPPNLTGIRSATNALPNVPQVACFDTAFHQTLPKHAYLYAVPYELYEKYGVRRYGFHGTSHRYVARRCAEIMGKGKTELNVITCHLGNGCSMAAVRQGYPVDTSMGLTPLEGLVMGTRSGDIDPAIIFYLVEQQGYAIEDVNKMLNKKSGLLGVSGVSNDVRTLLEAAADGDAQADLALKIYAYRVRKYIGAYTAVLDRVDAIVLTGGVGENASSVRRDMLSDLGHIGIQLDEAANNAAVGKEAIISTKGSPIQVHIIPTNEELAIAADTYELTAG